MSCEGHIISFCVLAPGCGTLFSLVTAVGYLVLEMYPDLRHGLSEVSQKKKNSPNSQTWTEKPTLMLRPDAQMFLDVAQPTDLAFFPNRVLEAMIC